MIVAELTSFQAFVLSQEFRNQNVTWTRPGSDQLDPEQ